MERWGEIKVLAPDVAESTLEGDELEAYQNYHQHVKDDMERMEAICNMMVDSLKKEERNCAQNEGTEKERQCQDGGD